MGDIEHNQKQPISFFKMIGFLSMGTFVVYIILLLIYISMSSSHVEVASSNTALASAPFTIDVVQLLVLCFPVLVSAIIQSVVIISLYTLIQRWVRRRAANHHKP